MASPSTSERRVTVRDEGLTLLYEPAQGKAIVNVIFVHGLGGQPRNSWTWRDQPAKQGRPGFGFGFGSRSKRLLDNYGKDVFWPIDLLPKDCPTARIWTWGYDSKVSQFFQDITNQSSVFDHANNLFHAIGRQMKAWAGHKIIFVAHSLGGIIVKEVLRKSEGAEHPNLRNIVTATYGILFIGTPHRGSNMADWGNILRKVAAVGGIDTNKKILEDLKVDSRVLQLSREEFLLQWRKYGFEVRTFQEGKGMMGFAGLNGEVVPKFSSTFDDLRERAQTINKNHMDLCKFYGVEDEGYDKVGGELKSLVEDIQGPQVRLPELEAIIEAPDENGWTALHQAVIDEDGSIIELFLKPKANLETQDEDGRTALHRAAVKGHEAVCKYLLENGAKVEAKDKYGLTALHIAAASGYEAICKGLLEKHGANIEAKDKQGLTALIWAAKYGREAICKCLREYGAKVEAKEDCYGSTALHMAAARGNEAICNCLLEEHGANIEGKDNDGWTALHMAAARGYEAICKCLLEHGAKVEAKEESYGRTALDIAKSSRSAQIKDKPDGWKEAVTGYDAVIQLLQNHRKTESKPLPPNPAPDPPQDDYTASAAPGITSVILHTRDISTNPAGTASTDY